MRWLLYLCFLIGLGIVPDCHPAEAQAPPLAGTNTAARATLRRATNPPAVIQWASPLVTMGGVKVRILGVPRNIACPTNTPPPQGASKFDYFKVLTCDAGSSGEIDDVSIKDSLTGKTVFSTTFDSASYTGIQTLCNPDAAKGPPGSTTCVPDTNRVYSFINQGVMNLGPSQPVEAHVNFTTKLPTNFEITYRARKLQWGGHYIMTIGTIASFNVLASEPELPPYCLGFSTRIEGTIIKQAVIPGYGDTMTNAPAYTTGDWAYYSIVMKNKVLTMSINSNVVSTCDMNLPPPKPLAPQIPTNALPQPPPPPN